MVSILVSQFTRLGFMSADNVLCNRRGVNTPISPPFSSFFQIYRRSIINHLTDRENLDGRRRDMEWEVVYHIIRNIVCVCVHVLTMRWLMTEVRALCSPLRQYRLRARHSNSPWLHICSSCGPNVLSAGGEKPPAISDKSTDIHRPGQMNCVK